MSKKSGFKTASGEELKPPSPKEQEIPHSRPSMSIPPQNEGQWLSCPFFASAFPKNTYICGIKIVVVREGVPLLENLPCTGNYKDCKEYLVKLKLNMAGYHHDPFMTDARRRIESLSIEEIEGKGNPVSLLYASRTFGEAMPEPDKMPSILKED